MILNYAISFFVGIAFTLLFIDFILTRFLSEFIYGIVTTVKEDTDDDK